MSTAAPGKERAVHGKRKNSITQAQFYTAATQKAAATAVGVNRMHAVTDDSNPTGADNNQLGDIMLVVTTHQSELGDPILVNEAMGQSQQYTGKTDYPWAPFQPSDAAANSANLEFFTGGDLLSTGSYEQV